MKDKKLKIGIIGCGVIAKDHLGAIKDHVKDYELYLCDSNMAMAQKWAKLYPVAGVFDGVETMLSTVSLDTAHLLTPPTSHKYLAKVCLEDNAHLFIEKPMALSVADTEEIYSLANKKNKKICVGHSLLYMDCVKQGIDCVKSGMLGEIISVHSVFGHSEKKKTIPYGGVSHWAYRMPGGPLVNLISHPASVVAELLGRPDEIQVMACQRNMMPYGMKDITQITTRHGTSYGSIMITMAHGNTTRIVNIECEKGSLHIDLSRQLCIKMNSKGKLGFISKALSGFRIGRSYISGTTGVIARVALGKMKSNPGTRYLVKAFYDRINTDASMPVGYDNVIAVSMIIDELIKQK